LLSGLLDPSVGTRLKDRDGIDPQDVIMSPSEERIEVPEDKI
jgi:hypothetical protein